MKSIEKRALKLINPVSLCNTSIYISHTVSFFFFLIKLLNEVRSLVIYQYVMLHSVFLVLKCVFPQSFVQSPLKALYNNKVP